MSQPTRWALVYAVFVVACATGGSNGGGGGGDDVNGHEDAAVNTPKDSNVSMLPDAKKMDASIPIPDAFVAMPDAASGPFCMNNSQCTMAGQCCFAINGNGICVNGVVIANVCFPQ